ncbi:anion permease [Flavobacterium procerum]|uniref:anion permease n=1 Tax=Flavobacterium procerum TaxID=1455569 RepID=UPI0035E82A58
MKEVKITQLLFRLVLVLRFWFFPAPDGVKVEAWICLPFLRKKIFGLFFKTAPMGTMCMIELH